MNKNRVRYLCELFGVGKSSYYDWIAKGKPKVNAYKKSIENTIINEFDSRKVKYGYRRLKHIILNATGEWISDYHVYKYMKINGRDGTSNNKKPRTKKILEDKRDVVNYINYQFKATKPNQKWYMDYTYVKVNGRWKYDAFIKDGWNNEIVPWHVLSSRSNEATKNL